MGRPRYTYGDSRLAAQRLALVAATFDPTSEAFLARLALPTVGLAVDLGCGPGHTTALVHRVLRAERTVGLDASEAFVDEARRSAPPGVAFLRHDATVVPFPVERPPDLVYARLLLAHLPDPAGVVARWVGAVAPGGLVLADDLEAVETDEPAFRGYLDEVALPVVRSEGGALLVGPLLHEAADPPGASRIADDVATFVPAARVTARLFAMNLAVLQERGEVQPHPMLADALRAIVDGVVSAEPARWHVRQIALRREIP